MFIKYMNTEEFKISLTKRNVNVTFNRMTFINQTRGTLIN